MEHVGIRQRRIRKQSRLGGEQYGLLAGIRGWGSVGAVDQAGVERNTARSRIKTQLDWIIPWLAVDVYRSGVGRSAIVAQPPVVRLPAGAESALFPLRGWWRHQIIADQHFGDVRLLAEHIGYSGDNRRIAVVHEHVGELVIDQSPRLAAG